jgi:hypothetical protein
LFDETVLHEELYDGGDNASRLTGDIREVTN